MNGLQRRLFWSQCARLVLVALLDVFLWMMSIIFCPLVIMVLLAGVPTVLTAHVRVWLIQAEKDCQTVWPSMQNKMPFPDAWRGRKLLDALFLLSLVILVLNCF